MFPEPTAMLRSVRSRMELFAKHESHSGADSEHALIAHQELRFGGKDQIFLNGKINAAEKI